VYPCVGHSYCANERKQTEFFGKNSLSFISSDSYIDSNDPNNPIKYYPYDRYYRKLSLDYSFETNFFVRKVELVQEYLFMNQD